jgi:hypothetical protein
MSNPSKRRRLRLRFSLKTLLIVITLTCIYFAVWQLTKRKGVPAVAQSGRIDVRSPLPLLVAFTTTDLEQAVVYSAGQISTVTINGSTRRHLAVWLFGSVWVTPIHWELSAGTSPALRRIRVYRQSPEPVGDGDSSSQETDLDGR